MDPTQAGLKWNQLISAFEENLELCIITQLKHLFQDLWLVQGAFLKEQLHMHLFQDGQNQTQTINPPLLDVISHKGQ